MPPLFPEVEPIFLGEKNAAFHGIRPKDYRQQQMEISLKNDWPT
jgi:hypothetical protein